jgi:hypothetical protein
LYPIQRFFDDERKDNSIKIAPSGQCSIAVLKQSKVRKMLHAQVGLDTLKLQDSGKSAIGNLFCIELGE